MLKAVEGFELQCGREYGFGNSKLPSRNVTQLHTIPESDLPGMPTENVSTCKVLLSTFSRRAIVSKYRNKQFTAKGIRDDMVLFQSQQSTISLEAKKIHSILNTREKLWTALQKDKLKEKIQKKVDASRSHDEYTKKLLQLCKSWGGPCTPPTELHFCLQNKGDIEAKIVKTELSYYVHTHQFQRHEVPQLFKINIPHEERLENILVLLGDNNSVATSTAASIPDLPTNEELHVNIIGEPDVPDQPHSIVNSMCVVVWEVTDGLNWFLGHVLEETVDMNYRIDHVEHSPDAQNVFWKYPAVPDV